MLLINKKNINLVAFLGICLTACVWLLIVAGAIYGVVYWYFRPQFVVKTPLNFSNLKTPSIEFPSIPLQYQDYAVTLELELPRSQFNQELRNFVVDMDLEGPKPSTALAMGMLPFKSPLIDLLDQIIFAPLYVFGFKDQVDLVRIDLFDFIDNPSKTYQSFTLSLSKTVQMSSATLVWSTKLHGFRKLMYHHPLSTCFVCVGFLWFSGLIVTITASLLVHIRLDETSEAPQRPVPTHLKHQSSQGQREGQREHSLEHNRIDTTVGHERHNENPQFHTPVTPLSPRAASPPRSSPREHSPRRRSQSPLRPHRPYSPHKSPAKYPRKSPLRLRKPYRSEDTTVDSDWQEETMPTIYKDFEDK